MATKVEPGMPMTPTERKVALRLVAGYSNAQIARDLLMAKPTVQMHITHLMKKSETTSRYEFACAWLLSGEVTPEDVRSIANVTPYYSGPHEYLGGPRVN